MSRIKTSSAKICRPELADVYVRERLIHALQPEPGCGACFVHAPAGSGKTTLLASYQQAVDPVGIWYRLDPGDADPAAFFYYLGLAARQATPKRRKPMPLLTANHLPSLRTFAQTFFEALFARIPRPGCLVLDDYHQLPEQSPLHDLLCETLAWLPNDIQVLIAGRHPPPPAFAGLIANRRMQLLGWEALKLREDEFRRILELHGESTPLDPDGLLEATDGWVAGLILLLRSGEFDRLDRLRAGRESHSLMFDYFAGEVFQRQAPEVRDLLLKTALLSQMTAQTAREISGHRHAERILSDLAEHQYFTVRRRGETDYYDYHALFRGFLLARAKDSYPADAWQKLNRQAAALEQAAGHTDSAIALYAATGGSDAIESLVCESAAELVSRGQFSTLRIWIDRIVPDHRKNAPWLQYWSAQCVLPFDPASALSHFETAFKGFQNPEDSKGLLIAWCGAVDTYINRYDRFEPLDRWIAWMDAWLERGLPFPDETLEGYVACSMANSLFHRQPYRDDVAGWFERAWSVAQRSNDSNLLIQTALSYMYWNLCTRRIGTFAKSKIVLDTLRRLIDFEQAAPMLKIMFLQQEYMVASLKGNFEVAQTFLTEALELAKSAEIHYQDGMLHALSACCPLIAGSAGQAAPHFERMAAAIRASPNLMHQSQYLYLRGWESFIRKDFRAALEYSEAGMEYALKAGGPFFLLVFGSGHALSLFENGRAGEAANVANEALDGAQRVGSPALEYNARFASAYFRLAENLDAQSLSMLRDALSFGRRHELTICNLWWHPELLERMFTTALDAGIEPEFVTENIRRRHFVPEHPPLTCKAWPWVLKVHTLGRFELVKDGETLEFGRKSPKKPLELLQALIALGGNDIAEQTLIDALWPDSEGDAAHNAFTTTLHRLRDLIGGEILSVSDGRVGLDPRRCWVDIQAFEDLLRRADRAAKGDDENFLQLARDGLELYPGHFLVSIPEVAWAITTRERLRARLLALLGAAGNRLEHNGRWLEAASWYQKALEIDPLAEEFYQGLMRSYLNLGRRAEAVQVYRRCRQTLFRSLGIQPGPATEKIHRQLGED